MAIDNNGFELERFTELLDTTEKEIDDYFESELDNSSNSLIGVLTNISTRGVSQVWELAQGAYDSIGLFSSEDNMLDNNALLVGHVRLPATYTQGLVNVTAKNGSVIPKDTIFSSVIENKFTANQEQIIASFECVNTRVYINNVVNEEEYSISVGISQYVYLSSESATKEEILLGLQTELGLEGSLKTEYLLDENSEPYLYLEWEGENTTQFSATTFCTFDYVTTPVLVTATESGEITANNNTINTIDTSGVVGVYYITNPISFVMGSDVESDYSLLNRILSDYSDVAGGTNTALYKGIASVEGVNSVKILSNRSYETLPSNQPPKSLKIVVSGGLDLSVAEEIWRTKPAGIHIWTDRTDIIRSRIQTIKDYNGQEHVIQFSRPQDKYAWVRVSYTLSSEEPFTEEGEEIITLSITDTGSKLSIGEDIIPKRFMGNVYKNVKGIVNLEISIALTDSLNDTPSEGDYKTNRQDITDEQLSNFSRARLEFI